MNDDKNGFWDAGEDLLEPGCSASRVQKLVVQWREANKRLVGGVVVLFEGVVQGWCNKLRDPGSWRPGCIAVDEAGRLWMTIGGNDADGAEEWLQTGSAQRHYQRTPTEK